MLENLFVILYFEVQLIIVNNALSIIMSQKSYRMFKVCVNIV